MLLHPQNSNTDVTNSSNSWKKKEWSAWRIVHLDKGDNLLGSSKNESQAVFEKYTITTCAVAAYNSVSADDSLIAFCER